MNQKTVKRQNDWYTGIDYFDNSKEKQIRVTKKRFLKPTELYIHDQVVLMFVESGKGELEINGTSYPLEQGSFLCMYMHHFYKVLEVREPIDVIQIEFYIGNFMFMCFEQHPGNANATLMYDTSPHIQLRGKAFSQVKRLADELVLEIKEKRFSSMNMVIYMTLQLHAYYCRFAFEEVHEQCPQKSSEWDIISKITLSAQKKLDFKELAKEAQLSEYQLNRRIKNACGMTLAQLQKFGKIINACALLHFPELSMEYISDILNFSSKSSFYKFFTEHMNMSPKIYQENHILQGEDLYGGHGHKALLFLQYMHHNFMYPIDVTSLAKEFYMKEYTVELIFHQIFQKTFKDLLNQIRTLYACSFLTSTDKQITEISDLCGFNSIATFQRVFRHEMGQSPSAYRKSMLQ